LRSSGETVVGKSAWSSHDCRGLRQPRAAQSDTGAVKRPDATLHEPDFELDETARIVVDAAVEVHRVLGPGLLESVYEQALSVELGLRSVRFAQQVPVAVTYKNVAIGEARLDLLVAERLVVELKACQGLLPLHFAQVLSYLKASDRSLGLLINFNVRLLRQGVRRVIRTR
jgi:GxxExxY protein